MLSPDGRLLYWSDDESGARAELLEEQGEAWEVSSYELEDLVYERSGRSLYGLNPYWGRIFSWSLDQWYPRELSLGVDAIEAFAMRPDAERWLLKGRRLGQAGLWLSDRLSGEVRELPMPEPERVLAMRWHGELDAVYLLRDDGSLWRSDGEGSAPTMLESSGFAIGLALSPREDAVLGIVLDPAGDAVQLVRPGQPAQTLLQADERIDDIGVSPDGREFALLLPDRIERRRLADAGLIETLDLPAASERGRRLHWSASWRMLVQRPGSGESLRLFDPSGAFCARDLAAVPGSNLIEADARRASGATGLRSQAIELIVDAQAAELPDLAIGDGDIRFLPATGAPGQSYSAIVAIRNPGRGSAWSADVDALLIQPDGSSRRFQRNVSVHRGQTHVLSLPLGVLMQEGEYRLHVALDPLDLIEESDERNNIAEQRLRLSADPAPQLRLSVANDQVGPDGRFDGEVRVETIAPFEGRVQLRLVDGEGHPVADLANEATGPISGASYWSRAWSWSPQGVLAGGYRVEGILRDRFDVQVSTAQLDLSVAAAHALSLSLQPQRSNAVVGDTVAVELGLDYLAGNALLTDGVLYLSALAPGGQEHSLWSGPTGLLMAGYSVRRTVPWSTSAAAETGTWRLRLRFAAAGAQRELLRELLLEPVPPSDLLGGSIELRPSASLVLGLPGRIAYGVENLGQVAHAALPVRVLVVPEGAASPLLEDHTSVALAPGAQVQGELELAALPQQPAAYLALLQAQRDGEWRTLAQRGFAAVDGMPPDVFLLAPDAERPQRSPGAIEVEAYDLHSRVERVQFSVDGGAWQALAASGNRYHSVLQALADGEHALRLRAWDTWGNQRETGPHPFVVDNTPPQILIEGVADGEHYNAAVVPLVEVVDAHPELLSVWLNGQPFDSGTEVETEGGYHLLVIAIDAAGNRSDRELLFVVDRSPPTLQILDPAPGAVLFDESVTVRIQTEALAEVTVESAGWSASASADADGLALFADVPLQLGVNRIHASALDRAGNHAEPVFVDVLRAAEAGEVSGSVLTPGTSHARGVELGLRVQAHNGRSQAVDGLLRLRVLTAGGQELHTGLDALLLGSGQTYERDHSLATGDWPLGPLMIELALEESSGTVALDTVGLDLVDASAPQLVALSPAANALLSGTVMLALHAIDDEAVAVAEFRIDAGEWQSLQREASGDTYVAQATLADGTHQVAYRARDAAGNQAQLLPITFVVDSTPPQILIDGAVDGGLFGAPVEPVVSVLDAHPDQLQLLLNGQPFVSGQRIGQSGSYVLHATAIDLAGNRSERSLAFELDLEPPVLLLHSPPEGALLAAPQVLVLGSTKPGAQVRLTGLASSHQTTADAEGQFALAGVALNEGENLLVAVATDALLRDSEPVERRVFHSPEALQGLGGSLRAQPEQVPAGAAFDLLATVEEGLGVGRQDLALRLRVTRAAATLALREWRTDLAGNARHEAVENFVGIATALGLHQAVLEVELDGAWQTLVQTGFVVVDRQAPDLAWSAPTPDSFHAGMVPVEIQASDALGSVTRVQARVAGGAWIELQPASGVSELWQGALSIASEGEALLQARAYDDADNLSDPVSRRVVIDRTPPIIVVGGVADGEIRNRAVQLAITVHDASPTQTVALLDGQPFVSGHSVETHGQHRLQVDAEDAAGNRSRAELSFELDLVPPQLTLVAPQPGSVLRSERVDVMGRSEALATIELAVAGHARSAQADAQGQFRFDGVPLRLGSNLIRARATDRAGNVGDWVEAAVERRGGAALRGSLELPASLRRGQSLLARVRVENQGEHALSGLGLRLLAFTPQGFERELDLRMADLGGDSSLEYQVSSNTRGWPQGPVSLRLFAIGESETQLASGSIQLSGSDAPIVVQPNVIPIAGPLSLFALVLLMMWLARRRLALGREARA